ncbi:MAG: NADH-quinone oxidoreductase subunit L [Bacteroidia bacterium]
MTFFLPLALVLPLIGSLSLGIGGLLFPGLRRYKTTLGLIGTLAVAIPAAIFFYAFLYYPQKPYIIQTVFPWIPLGEGYGVPLRFILDPVALIMSLIVTGIGGLIHLYSMGYMHEDDGVWRYFSYLNLFIFSMLVLVLADNLPLVFLGWEGVGLCSYLLIGFWYKEWANSAAAQKAFIMNRIGDVAFLAGVFALYSGCGTVDFTYAAQRLGDSEIALWAGLLFFFASTGKSAQLPLFTWLPDAMAGPTPVSALIHAATMVTAGVYLSARLHFVYNLAPQVLEVIAWVAALTALLAALQALVQTDIKKVLAYSTVSQLGLMFLAVGAGAYSVALFHVFTHAFFKAALFLGSGSVIHATGSQDIRQMGGLAKVMPWTRAMFWISALALAGVPPLAGFFSKDLILESAFAAGKIAGSYYFLWGIGLLVAFLTGFYMVRVSYYTFEGQPRHAHAVHEGPIIMLLPIAILTVGSLFAGIWGSHWMDERMTFFWQVGHSLQDRMLPSLPRLFDESVEAEILLMGLSIAIAFSGVLAGFYLFRRGPQVDDQLKKKWILLRWAENGFYIDRFYQRYLVEPLRILAQFLYDVLEKFAFPKTAGAIANLPFTFATLLQNLHKGFLTSYMQWGFVLVIVLLFLILL